MLTPHLKEIWATALGIRRKEKTKILSSKSIIVNTHKISKLLQNEMMFLFSGL